MSVATAKRFPSKDGLVIIEKYDAVFQYLYPKVQVMPRAQGRFRDRMLDTLLRIPGEIYLAVKVNQVSKLNILDSSLAELRWHLRFAGSGSVKMMTPRQQAIAEGLIYEVGVIINAWRAKSR